MNTEILNNYLDNNSIDKSNLKINYSFEEINNGVVYNELYSNEDHYPSVGCLNASVHPGILVSCENHPEFEDFKNCCSMGYFDSRTTLRIGDNVDYPSWSVFINYNNNVIRNDRDKAEVILSSMSSPSDLSGFNFGINGSNRLYLEYVNTNGILKNIILSKEVELYNLVSLSKSAGALSITNHDPFSRKNYSVDYYLTDFVDSNIWTLGGFYETGGLERYRGFKGFLDDFILFDSEFSMDHRNLISQGLYFTGIKDAYEIETTKTIETITGAPTIVSTPTSSAVVGFNMVPINDIQTSCSSPVTVCKKELVYGQGYEDLLSFEKVNIDITEIELVPEERLYNEVYTSSYGEKNVVFLKNIDLKDIYQIYSQSGFDSDLNHSTSFDTSYNSFIISGDHVGDNLNVFVNGVHSLPIQNYSLSDFYLSSGTGYSYDIDDVLLYDVISSPMVTHVYDGAAYPTLTLTGATYINKDIYFKGQKLLSGQDYIEFFEYDNNNVMSNSGVDISALEETSVLGISGDYAFVLPGSLRSTVYTGTIDAYDKLTFNLRNEQIWLNGYRQIEDVDYIKTSDKSLLNSNLRLESKSYLIYNNSEDFWDLTL